MKIGMGKGMWSILFVGILVVGVAASGAAYLNQVQEQKRLTDELTSAQDKAAAISPDKIIVQKTADQVQLTQYQAKIADAKTQLTAPLVVTDIFQRLLTTANNTKVSATLISSSAVTDALVAGLHYQALSLNFAVTGNAPDIYKFVDAAGTTFSTGVLKTMDISIPQSAGGSTDEPKANMQLTIYSYRGE